MAITKGSEITAADINDFNRTKSDYINKSRTSGKVFTTTSDTKIGYFWLRADRGYETGDEYNALTTYITDYLCAVENPANTWTLYKSLQDGNIGNAPASSPLYWEEVESRSGTFNPFISNRPTYYDPPYYWNIKVVTDISGVFSGSNDYNQVQIWKVNVAEPEDLTLLYDTGEEGNTTDYRAFEAGYYKYRLYSRARGSSSTSTATLYAKRGSNNMLTHDTIRVWDTDYHELLPRYQNKLTVDLAKTGRLTSNNYVGGDF